MESGCFLLEAIIRDPGTYGLPIVSGARKINTGVVHHVWELDTAQGKFYLKIRGDRFARVPEIRTEPRNICYEFKATRLLHATLPAVFPRPVYFDEASASLITADVIRDGATLESMLLAGDADTHTVQNLGRSLRFIHHACHGMTESIHENHDRDFFNDKLRHKLGFRSHPILQEVIVELSHCQPRQLIVGDPSPKNIGVSNHGRHIAFFDLEDVHRGNTVFDFGFMLGHLILHGLNDVFYAQSLATGFLQGYGDPTDGGRLAKAIALGTMLYRLHSIIPYCVGFPQEAGRDLSQRVEAMLHEVKNGDISWQSIIARLSGDRRG